MRVPCRQPLVIRTLCSLSGLNRVSLVRAVEQTFRTVVFDALGGKKVGYLLGRPTRRRPVLPFVRILDSTNISFRRVVQGGCPQCSGSRKREVMPWSRRSAPPPSRPALLSRRATSKFPFWDAAIKASGENKRSAPPRHRPVPSCPAPQSRRATSGSRFETLPSRQWFRPCSGCSLAEAAVSASAPLQGPYPRQLHAGDSKGHPHRHQRYSSLMN